MLNTKSIVLAFLLFFVLTTNTKSIENKDIFIINGTQLLAKIPEKNWLITVSDVEVEDKYSVVFSNNKSFSDCSASVYKGDFYLGIKLYITKLTIGKTFRKFKENYTICGYSKKHFDKCNLSIIKGFKGDSCYVADYFQPEWDEMGIRARKLIAIMEYDGVIMDIEISKIFYQDSDAAEFQRILNSIEFVELKQE